MAFPSPRPVSPVGRSALCAVTVWAKRGAVETLGVWCGCTAGVAQWPMVPSEERIAVPTESGQTLRKTASKRSISS